MRPVHERVAVKASIVFRGDTEMGPMVSRTERAERHSQDHNVPTIHRGPG